MDKHKLIGKMRLKILNFSILFELINDLLNIDFNLIRIKIILF